MAELPNQEVRYFFWSEGVSMAAESCMLRQAVRRARGVALVTVLVTAVVFSIAAFSALMISLASRQRSQQSSEGRLRAQYADEAGLVYAMQNLWADPNYPKPCCASSCAGQNQSEFLDLDTDGNGSKETQVTITVTNCGAGRNHTLSAKVTF